MIFTALFHLIRGQRQDVHDDVQTVAECTVGQGKQICLRVFPLARIREFASHTFDCTEKKRLEMTYKFYSAVISSRLTPHFDWFIPLAAPVPQGTVALCSSVLWQRARPNQ